MPRQAGPADMARRLGERVKQLRQGAQLTQETLAWDCDLAKAYLSQVESGKRLPSVPVLYKLAERLGLDVVDLLSVDPELPQHRLLEAYRLADVAELRRLVEQKEGGLVAPTDPAQPRAANPLPGPAPGGNQARLASPYLVPQPHLSPRLHLIQRRLPLASSATSERAANGLGNAVQILTGGA